VQCPGPGRPVVDLERHEIPAGNLVDSIVTFTTGISSTLQRRSARMESRMPTMEMPRAANAIMSEVLNDCLLCSTPGIPGVLKTTAFPFEQPVGSPPARLVRQCKARPPAAMFPPIPPAAPPFPCRGSRCRTVHPRLFRHRFHFIGACPCPVPDAAEAGEVSRPGLSSGGALVSSGATSPPGGAKAGEGTALGGGCDRHGDRMRSRHACRWRRLVPFDQRCAPQRVRVPDRGRRRPAVHPFPGFPA
jgi:hypothetical protein